MSIDNQMAYVAIKTQWLAPTKYKGGRIKATAMDCFTNGTFPSITKASVYYYGYTTTQKIADSVRHSQEKNHHAVAMELLPQVCNSPNDVELVAGATRTGYVFVIQQKVGV
tara:strand:+ start:124 stop:456 length:333 start_codon:yes stop_codon:yes gene_type:complete